MFAVARGGANPSNAGEGADEEDKQKLDSQSIKIDNQMKSVASAKPRTSQKLAKHKIDHVIA